MSKCKNILIVEDDKAIRESFKTALELEGYDVKVAANGREGIDVLPNIETPCLILLDLMMPVMNGWQFVEALGKDMMLASIPVVLVTAFPDRAIDLKTSGLIKKPVDLDILLDTVKSYCGDPSSP